MRRTIAFILAVAVVIVMFSGCSKIRYAADYPITIGEKKKDVNGEWSVEKCVKDDLLYLYVKRNKHDKDPLDYIDILVYDNAYEARKAYDKQYEFSKEKGDKTVWEEGENWFTGGNPQQLFGYETTTIYCVEDNVLICTVIYQADEAQNIPFVPIERVDKSIDRATLKPYVIENAAYIRKTVLKDVLGYK